MDTDRPLHLVTVWNPSYSEDALDAHLEVLLHWADRFARDRSTMEDVYVWWGKVRSANRLEPLAHEDDILRIDDQTKSGEETHLYLTDYRSLYVGHLVEITEEELSSSKQESLHIPPYYAEQKLNVELWFRLADIRRLVADDTLTTIEELKRLRNTAYHDKPVSLYGGMVDLPLIVFREDHRTWFQDKDLQIDGHLWAEEDADLRGETERIARDLRDNLFGRTLWSILEPATRTFLSTAEATFRARRDDPRFDFSGPGLGYAKAIETELNGLLFPRIRNLLKSKAPAHRVTHLGGQELDLGRRIRHQTLGQIKLLLEKDAIVRKSVRTALPKDAKWLTDQLVYSLREVTDFRNKAAHAEDIESDEAEKVREEILGIGQEGLVVRIARAKLRAGL